MKNSIERQYKNYRKLKLKNYISLESFKNIMKTNQFVLVLAKRLQLDNMVRYRYFWEHLGNVSTKEIKERLSFLINKYLINSPIEEEEQGEENIFIPKKAIKFLNEYILFLIETIKKSMDIEVSDNFLNEIEYLSKYFYFHVNQNNFLDYFLMNNLNRNDPKRIVEFKKKLFYRKYTYLEKFNDQIKNDKNSNIFYKIILIFLNENFKEKSEFWNKSMESINLKNAIDGGSNADNKNKIAPKRAILLIIDSVGIGNGNRADEFDSVGANTLKHTVEKTKISLPNLAKLGLMRLIYPLNRDHDYGLALKSNEFSEGKDTLVGHFEMMGVYTKKRYLTYLGPEGFPKDLISEFEKRTGRKAICLLNGSGVKIINQYYNQHLKEGAFIVYTSPDSTFQIAAHMDVINIKELNEAALIARELCDREDKPHWRMARIITRPFSGDLEKGLVRNAKLRKDIAIVPTYSYLNLLQDNNVFVSSIGKINDIFSGRGIDDSQKTFSNKNGLETLIKHLDNKKEANEFVFVNLVDFDSKFGHVRDVEGYSKALIEFDSYIPLILDKLDQNDLLIIAADHGNDPTYKGNDHTREQIPILIFSKDRKSIFFNKRIIQKPRNSFADIGKTIIKYFDIKDNKLPGYNIDY